MSRNDYEKWNAQQQAQRFRWRKYQNHPEPTSFSRLDYIPSWNGLRTVRIDQQDHDTAVRELINIKLFNGRLHWVDLSKVPNLSRHLRKKSPFAVDVIHRHFPSLNVPTPAGHKDTQVAIHLNDATFVSSAESQ